MKKSAKLFALGAGLLLLGLGAPAAVHAQGPPPPPMQQPGDNPPPPPGYADYGYTLDDYAAYNGYHGGYDKGMSDRNTGHSYRATEDHIYHDPPGFKGGKYSRDEYKRVYREAYLRGYEKGYRH